MKRTVLIVAALILFLMVLWPPWRSPEYGSQGYAPLFSPPQYTVTLEAWTSGRAAKYDPPRFERNSFTGREELVEGRVIEEAVPATPGRYEKREAVIAWGQLLTTMLAVAGIATTVFLTVDGWRK